MGAADHGGSFVGVNNVDGLGRFGGDIDVFMFAEAGVVLFVVNFEAEIGEAGDDVTADFGIALADGGGKDESVDTLHGGNHFTDGALDAVDIHIIGKLGARMVGTGGENFAHVAANTANAEEATLAIKVFFDSFFVKTELVLDGDGGGRVKIAGAGGHHDAFKWRVAHGGVVRITILDGGK